jgi:hypothetical protein
VLSTNHGIGFGLYQAIFMANAGGAWDNAKKVVEVDLKIATSLRLMSRPVIGEDARACQSSSRPLQKYARFDLALAWVVLGR